MDTRMHCCVVLACIMYLIRDLGVECAYSAEMETEIRNETIYGSNYDYISRPKAQTHIKIGINVLAIDELNLKEQKLTVAGWLTLEWDDYRLAWNKTEKDDIKYIFSRPQHIWKPELIVDNSLENLGVLHDRDLYLRIEYAGVVEWEPPRLFTTHCEVDITYYPYDKQKCGIEIVSWGYTYDEVTLDHLYETINLEDFVPHGEWEIEYTAIEDKNLTEHHPDGTLLIYPQLNFWIHLKRRTQFYNLNVMLPIILTSVMVGLSFIVPLDAGEKLTYVLTVFLSITVLLTIISEKLPPTSISTSLLERRTQFYNLNVMMPIVLTSLMAGMVFLVPISSGEKISFGMTVFLSLAVLLTIVSDALPPTSISTSILGLYLGIVLVSSSFGILLTVLILIVFHHSGTPHESSFILTITRCAARCIRWHYPNAPNQDDSAKQSKSKTRKGNIPNTTNSCSSTTNIVKVVPLELEDVEDAHNDDNDDNGCCDNGDDVDVEPITWKRVAQILDRFLFYVFFAVNVTMNITFVLVLSAGSGTEDTTHTMVAAGGGGH